MYEKKNTPSRDCGQVPKRFAPLLQITGLEEYLRDTWRRTLQQEVALLFFPPDGRRLAVVLRAAVLAPPSDLPGFLGLDLARDVRRSLVAEWTRRPLHRRRWGQLAHEGHDLDFHPWERGRLLVLAADRSIDRVWEQRSPKPLANAINEEATKWIRERAGEVPPQKAVPPERAVGDPIGPEDLLRHREEAAAQEYHQALARRILEEVAPNALTGFELRDFILRYGEEQLTEPQIAKQTGVKTGTVSARLNKARQKIKAELQARSVESPW